MMDQTIKHSTMSNYAVEALVLDRIGALPELPTLFDARVIRSVKANPRRRAWMSQVKGSPRNASLVRRYIGESLVTFMELTHPNATMMVTFPGLLLERPYVTAPSGAPIPLRCHLTFSPHGTYLGLECSDQGAFPAADIIHGIMRELGRCHAAGEVLLHVQERGGSGHSSVVIGLFPEDPSSHRERLEEAFESASDEWLTRRL